MARYSFLLITLIGFSTISVARADVCDPEWWKTATISDLEALNVNEQAFPEFCNVWKDTPLHFAVQHCQNAEVVAAFIDITSAKVLAVNDQEKTPLDLAQDRLNIANILAESTRDSYLNAMRNSARARMSESLRHLRTQMNQMAVEARREMNQASDEEEIAEAIYQLFSDFH